MARVLFVGLVVGLVAPSVAMGQISYSTSGATYSQNFDVLATTDTTNTWSNNVTLEGWFLFRQPAAGPVAITTYAAGTGSSATGGFYSFGTGTETDRALGGLGSGGTYFGSPASGAVAGWEAVALTNNTGSMIDGVEVLYDGEQWRNGGNATPQTMVLEWGIGATFDAVVWNSAGAGFNFTSPIATTASALNGNDPANRIADIGGSLSSLGWDLGETLWFRWIENNDAGNDHGLAVDNFRLTGFSPVPEPSAFLLGLLGLGGFLIVRRPAAADSR